MRKQLSLKNLGLYWTSDVPELFGDLPVPTIKQNMKDLILKDQTPQNKRLEYMIAISATCRLIQKNKKDPAVALGPEFVVSLSLKPLDLQLKKPQLEDVIRLLEFFNSYNRFKISAMKEREEEAEHLTLEEKKQMREEFQTQFGRIYRDEKAQVLRGEEKVKAVLTDDKEFNRFETLVMSLPDEELSVVIKEVVIEIEREKRTKAIEAQKTAQTEKKGWFGWSSKKKEELKDADASRLNAADVEEIEKYIKETFGEDEDPSAKLGELAYQNLFALSFTLEGGTFYFSNMTASNDEEGVMLSYKSLSAKVDMNSKGKRVNVCLKDYGVSLRTRYAGTTSFIDTPIVRRQNYWLSSDASEDMITVQFDENPQGKEEGTYIKLDSRAVEIIYRPVAIERLVSFFDVSSSDEALKSQAWQQLEKGTRSSKSSS